jgi:hypothetical protein
MPPVGAAGRPATAGARTTRTAAARSTSTRSTVSSRQDGQIVTSLIVAFVLLVGVVILLRVRGGARVDTSVAAVSGTLKDVHVRQSNFRLLNQRYASARELEARGLRLPETQVVVSSNATMSHWFMVIRDSATGVVCEKTGELFDEGPDARKPSCRETPP